MAFQIKFTLQTILINVKRSVAQPASTLQVKLRLKLWQRRFEEKFIFWDESLEVQSYQGSTVKIINILTQIYGNEFRLKIKPFPLLINRWMASIPGEPKSSLCSKPSNHLQREGEEVNEELKNGMVG